MKAVVYDFFSLTNLNLYVNSIPQIVKIHIRLRPGTQRKSRVKAYESGYSWNGMFFFLPESAFSPHETNEFAHWNRLFFKALSRAVS